MSSPLPPATGYLVYEFERRAYPIGEGTFTIGRDAGSNVVIREPAVSRVHAEVYQTEGGSELRPTGPTGTIVNGIPLAGPYILQEGDAVEVGTAKLTYYGTRLPLGVSIVDHGSGQNGDPSNRRTTITNPILGHDRPDPNVTKSTRWILPGLLVLAVIAYFVFGG